MAVEFVQVCKAVEFVGFEPPGLAVEAIEIERAGIAFDHNCSGLATDSIVPGRTGMAVEHEGTGRAVGSGEFDSANRATEFKRTDFTMAIESVVCVCTGMAGKSEHRLAPRVRRFRAHRHDSRAQAHLHGPERFKFECTDLAVEFEHASLAVESAGSRTTAWPSIPSTSSAPA